MANFETHLLGKIQVAYRPKNVACLIELWLRRKKSTKTCYFPRFLKIFQGENKELTINLAIGVIYNHFGAPSALFEF